MVNGSRQLGSRYGAIDGLRGLAALGVVFYHLASSLSSELEVALPSFVNSIISYGYLGVPIFFVISGFVISLSVGDAKVSFKYFGNFALRRSIRLDVTYWASILFALVLLAMKNVYLAGDEPMPSWQDILLHMFYLQELFSVDPVISVVYWTLCLEVQLYVFYILSFWFTQSFGRLLGSNYYFIHLLVIISLGIYSILVDLSITSIGIKGLFISSWHYFLMGILVCNVVRNKAHSSKILIAWLMIELLFQVSGYFKEYAIAGTLCALFIFTLWRFDALNKVLTGRVFQYFGTLSYTLYLIHPDVGWKVIELGKRFLGDNMSPSVAILLLVVGILVSIIVAHLFHLLFEKPSLVLCKRLKHTSLKNIILDSWRNKFIKA
jgi:peptidoglycan/LPS O-acetylase OafA/YrhL